MTKITATAAAALLALAPLTAHADSVLLLDSTKSSGNLNAGVGDDVVVVDDAPVLTGGGLGTTGAIVAGLGAILLLAAVASDDDDDDSSSTTGEDHDSDN